MTPTGVIGSLVDTVEKIDPARKWPDDTFTYIDIAAVDQTLKEINSPQRLRTGDAPSRARQLVSAGDVLVSTVRPNLNAVAQVPNRLDGAVASTGFAVLRSRAELLDPRYLFHWVRSPTFIGEMTRRATGASYPAVSDMVVKASEIPLPPIEEQRRIAAVLDQADELRAKRQACLALLDSLNESIFLAMFGEPAKWTQAEQRLIELVDPDRPISYGILKPGPDVPDGVPYVRVVDMRLGGVDASSVKRTTPEISHQYRRSLLRSGDLLLSIRGHVGRLAEVPLELDGANITQDTARLAVKGANPRFVLQYLRTIWAQRWMDSNTKGAAVRGINLGDVKRLPVPVFERDAQDEFVRRVRVAERTAEAQHRSIGTLSELFASLQQRAFAGQL